MPNNAPYSAIDIPEVMSRNLAARDIVSGFASAMPTLSVAWQHLQAALADTRDLAAEVTRLSAELAAARLRHANALAAMRATIGAQRDGEPDAEAAQQLVEQRAVGMHLGRGTHAGGDLQKFNAVTDLDRGAARPWRPG